ncbi:Glutathione peroxidase BsaA [Paenibacillus plantiphilus]|uniref:Glutathione peroxidase n=1 Tax=Paenibacillus plantiphilus TaxID=2905650 RepID=A0ABN8GZN8_9BACL|nr:glutathione peroxidase [Paenibacillus plantiphilus]CAH1218059.1 Glutathione peroxidase BsaA [Paenibacillus plantiphilus]
MSVYDFSVQTIRGEQKPLADYKGQVLLIVNTASKCGFAPQFDELQELYERYKDRGFTVLAFPSNQFREQEPGSNDEVEQVCKLNFGVSFPLFAKIDVNGAGAEPLYTYLKKERGGMFGSSIKWNFTKFLIDSEGRVVKRYSPTTKPTKFERRIVELLDEANR